MEYYMDEKWKLSKEDPNNHSYNSSSKSSLRRSYSQHCPISSDPSHLPRSFSTKTSTSSSSKSRLSKSSSQRSSTNFKSKCSTMAKEQKAKFYIVKRCIAMLVRWNKHDKHRDS
ncbi:hypothetical protein A4A49_12303 [Nicotiana attenuata]|uniref:Uncharacterized protein n=1 Tax=Nicotiana attenuata TaxID=49451 RepID=A0A1J6INK5_NICAT|nr:hypothetical protein A4A49_12303 [Nicotiana attenuata]